MVRSQFNRRVYSLFRQNPDLYREILDLRNESSVDKSTLRRYLLQHSPGNSYVKNMGIGLLLTGGIGASIILGIPDVEKILDRSYLDPCGIGGEILTCTTGAIHMLFDRPLERFYDKLKGIEYYEEVRDSRKRNKIAGLG